MLSIQTLGGSEGTMTLTRSSSSKVASRPQRPLLGNIRDGENDDVEVQSCFTSTETIRTIKDGEPCTATSTCTQLLSSEKKKEKMMTLLMRTI